MGLGVPGKQEVEVMESTFEESAQSILGPPEMLAYSSIAIDMEGHSSKPLP